ncbi:hypothetical protein [Actinoplanes sp. N902-109]|uniref:hypothetical protein n=1 Tax=Actinoplanes sp. (strain N902-109) TaxID=649831 RepID=UPI0003293612|nr:hypothetical protein [Actinoplanes sp. N902-109]AGL17627.1 hypothetical protein L083_4117 [Actinoplanes sp. N902-109]
MTDHIPADHIPADHPPANEISADESPIFAKRGRLSRRTLMGRIGIALAGGVAGPFVHQAFAQAYVPCEETRCTLYGVACRSGKVYAWYKCYDRHSGEFCFDAYYLLGNC